MSAKKTGDAKQKKGATPKAEEPVVEKIDTAQQGLFPSTIIPQISKRADLLSADIEAMKTLSLKVHDGRVALGELMAEHGYGPGSVYTDENRGIQITMPKPKAPPPQLKRLDEEQKAFFRERRKRGDKPVGEDVMKKPEEESAAPRRSRAGLTEVPKPAPEEAGVAVG